MFYNNAKKEAIAKLKRAESKYNSTAKMTQKDAVELYQERKLASNAIQRVQDYINSLSNTPKEFLKDVADVIDSIREFREAIKIEEENSSANIKAASAAAGGVAAGGVVAGLGPTALMAIATTFGTASTGTAIASLTGAAATNAALAWLGGGALAAGGGGMAAGNVFLGMCGPVGWTVAGVFAVGGAGFSMWKNKKAAEEAMNATRKINKEYLRIFKISQNIKRLIPATQNARKLISVTPFNMYPRDYKKFNFAQQTALAKLINETRALGNLINEKIAL